MIPLFIYKDTHLRRQITKTYNYETKGVKRTRKKERFITMSRSDSLLRQNT